MTLLRLIAFAVVLVALSCGSVQASPAAPTCRTVHAYRHFKNVVGIVFWRYVLQVEWCTFKGRITSLNHIRVGEVYGGVPILKWGSWKFEGHVDGGVSSGPFKRTVWTQGHFKVCALPGGAICRDEYPSMSITVDGQGRFSSWTRP